MTSKKGHFSWGMAHPFSIAEFEISALNQKMLCKWRLKGKGNQVETVSFHLYHYCTQKVKPEEQEWYLDYCETQDQDIIHVFHRSLLYN
jgi:hypothetical protein